MSYEIEAHIKRTHQRTTMVMMLCGVMGLISILTVGWALYQQGEYRRYCQARGQTFVTVDSGLNACLSRDNKLTFID